MRKLAILVLASVWMAPPSSADVLGDLSIRDQSDFSNASFAVRQDTGHISDIGVANRVRVSPVAVYTTTLTLTDGTTIIGEGSTQDEASQDAAAIYFNSVVEVPTE